jgi:tight adherence protein C
MPQIDLLNQQQVFALLLFTAVFVMAWVLLGVLLKRDENPLKNRLKSPTRSIEVDDIPKEGVFAPLVNRISRAAAAPLMPKQREEHSRLRKRLIFAGMYSNSAMHLFVGARIMLLLGGLAFGALVALSFKEPLLSISAAAFVGLLGFVLPLLWLSGRINKRRRKLESSLPDVLDLMVVCVEAGLTLDAAVQRVGHEISLAHPEISQELGITHMETRIGISRVDALRNLGHRTGSPSLQSLAAMLVQAERFGTSIAAALRVFADSLRTKRQYAAEEQAAKTTVKLAFPVVLFIFPTVLVVLGGPAFILFYRSPLFANR